MANAPSVQAVALQLLRYNGITQLAPQPVGSLMESVTGLGDLQEVVSAMNAAVQEYFNRMPSQGREFPMGVQLNSPTTVSVNCTAGSNAITFGSGWASWMVGCTIRLQGDQQDNEILNATTLVLPFQGATGLVGGTVYHDAVVLDETVAKVIGPVTLPYQLPLHPCKDRNDYIHWSNWPLVVNESGYPLGYPFFNFVQKSIQRPRAWFVEGIFNAALSYVQKRLRFAPMPDQQYSAAYRVVMMPPRFLVTDICPDWVGGTYTDPGTVIPIADEIVESAFLPIALHHYATKPGFKNDSLIPRIEEMYKFACEQLMETIGQISLTEGNYIG